MNERDVFFQEVLKRASQSALLSRAAKTVKDFAKRQAHGLTGAYGHQAAELGLNPEAVRAGATSLPGLVRGLSKHPGETLRAVKNEALGNNMVAGLGLGVGAPLAFATPDLLRGDESARGGRTLRQKTVGLGANIAGGALTAGVPIVPQAIGSMALESAASHLARRGG